MYPWALGSQLAVFSNLSDPGLSLECRDWPCCTSGHVPVCWDVRFPSLGVLKCFFDQPHPPRWDGPPWAKISPSSCKLLLGGILSTMRKVTPIATQQTALFIPGSNEFFVGSDLVCFLLLGSHRSKPAWGRKSLFHLTAHSPSWKEGKAGMEPVFYLPGLSARRWHHPPLSIINQENTPETCLEASLMEAFSQLRFCLPRWLIFFLVNVKLTKN